MKLETRPREIGGLTTFCSEQHLNEFLSNSQLNKVQPFEIYQGPPLLLPPHSLIFIFQTGKGHRLRAIARNVGWTKVNGWLKNINDREDFCKSLASRLEDFYLKENIQPHCVGEKLIEFCSRKDGVRGIFFFDKIVEVNYKSPKDWFKRGDFQKLFGGAQPYAQGFPFRYLTVEEKQLILEELRRKGCISKADDNTSWLV